MFLNGVLSRREKNMIEMDRYNRQEYEGEYRNSWVYGNDSVEEIESEYDILEKGYYIEEYIED